MEENRQMAGKQSLLFKNPPYIQTSACIAGKKEGEGPLGHLIEEINEDPMFGMNTWEEAESSLQTLTVNKLLKKANLTADEIRYIFAGDLLGQLIGTTFGIKEFDIPLFGLYGACSTMGESMALASMCVNAGYADRVIALASSHFAGAEKQFRFPLEYGNQRPLSASWTVTGCGSVIIGKEKSLVKIAGITTGKVVDYGVKDSMNMGACMAPAAADLIYANFMDLNVDEKYYDMIITGDLGNIGQTILLELLKDKGFDISKNHMDCGLMIYDESTQDTHAGGSGCGCSAVVLCCYILKQLEKKRWNRVLFIPTGAMLSPVSFNEGKSVPGVAHGIILESV
ncbi:MAG: stage V sporulation protein AD [Thermoflexaceae bacterium]|nr:stage V sporulation protein AD [Thermoflexaceae bacterium]